VQHCAAVDRGEDVRVEVIVSSKVSELIKLTSGVRPAQSRTTLKASRTSQELDSARVAARLSLDLARTSVKFYVLGDY
jgi:hypothetical protein